MDSSVPGLLIKSAVFSLADHRWCEKFRTSAMKSHPDSTCIELPIKTVEGTFTAQYSATGLFSLRFPKDTSQNKKDELSVSDELQSWHRKTSQAVNEVLDGKQPDESFYDGLEITELLMTAYMSAEQERTIQFRPDGLETFVPLVAQGLWKGR